MKARFYGGPLDGRIMEVADSAQTIEVPEPAGPPSAAPVSNTATTFRRGTYRRQVRRVDDPENLTYLEVPMVWEGWR